MGSGLDSSWWRYPATEVIVVDGTGKIEITGQLGDVMKESVKAGISYIRSQAGVGIESDFTQKDIHSRARRRCPQGGLRQDCF